MEKARKRHKNPDGRSSIYLGQMVTGTVASRWA